MNRFKHFSYCLYLILSSLLISFFVIGIVKFKLDRFYEVSNRMINCRLFNTEQFVDVIDYFLMRKTITSNTFELLVIGDSQPFGAHYKVNNTFPSLIENKLGRGTVLNLSFNDQRIGDTSEIFDILKRKNIHIKNVLIAIDDGHPRFNSFKWIKNQKKANGYKILLYPKIIIQALFEERNYKHPMEYSNQTLKDYFEDTTNMEFQKSVDVLFKKAKGIADQVYIYITPHPTLGLEYLGYSWKDLEVFYEMINQKCQSHRVHCIFPYEKFDRHDFFDIAHFNQLGHEKMAEIIYKKLKDNSD
jgi:hypothetical protein